MDQRLEILRAYMKAEGKKNRWLSAKLGMAETDFSKVFTGRRPLTPDLVERINAITGLQMEVHL